MFRTVDNFVCGVGSNFRRYAGVIMPMVAVVVVVYAARGCTIVSPQDTTHSAGQPTETAEKEDSKEDKKTSHEPLRIEIKHDREWHQRHRTDKAAIIRQGEHIARLKDMDPDLILSIAAAESRLNSEIVNRSTGATGLMQFMKPTWEGQKKISQAHNVSMTNSYDNLSLGADLTKDTAIAMSMHTSDGKAALSDIYVGHIMGIPAGKKFLDTRPDADAVAAFPEEASYNRSVFFNKDGTHRSVAGTYNEIAQRVGNGRQYVAMHR